MEEDHWTMPKALYEPPPERKRILSYIPWVKIGLIMALILTVYWVLIVATAIHDVWEKL